MGLEDLLNGKAEVATPTPEVEAPQPEVTAEAIEPTQEPTPEPAPDVETTKEEKFIPLAVGLDWRDGKKAAEDRAKQLERELAEMRAAQQPTKMPDPLDDPQGHAAFLEQRLQGALVAERFESSNETAREKYGDEAVEAATNWALEKANVDPTFAAQYMRERRPVEWIVRQHKRDGLLSQIGDNDLDTFVKTYVSQNGERLGLTAPAAPAAVPQQAPVTPPQSIASAPSNGGVKDVPVHPMAGLEALFNR